MTDLNEALKALRQGLPVMIFDSTSRENEIDLVVHASKVDVDTIHMMRTLAGGLICFAMPKGVASILGLDFFTNYLREHTMLRLLVKKPRYGDEPAFSIWVNHVAVSTGIRDSDRALTIRELYKVVEMVFQGRYGEARSYFYNNFYSPGHVPILINRRLTVRRGHTELSLYLAALADIIPAMVLVEMLDRGEALSLEKAFEIAKDLGIPLITSDDIVSEVLKLGEDRYCRYYLC